jgi:hypothetical protein
MLVLGAVLLVVLTACAPSGEQAAQPAPSPTSSTIEATTTTTVPDEGEAETSTPTTRPDLGNRSALDLFAGGNNGAQYPSTFPAPMIDTSELLRGQVPDGIPALDSPQFVSVAEADAYLENDEAVVVLNIDGDVRAYPAQILIWHEIVNDVVGGIPVAVTYCPLCNSAVTYERTVQGEVTTFGTSGLLFNSALVMYDRLTESLWTHYNGEAIAGAVSGVRLEPIPSPLLGWAEFRETFPDGLVLDRDRTGHSRSYGSNPYANYDNPTGFPFLFRGELDEQIGAQRRVTGVSIEGVATAWTLEAISDGTAQATSGSVGDQAVVIFWKAGQATALESGEIAGGRDVGSVGVFVPEADGQALTFAAQGQVFIDDQTGSTWNIFGEAVGGPLVGTELVQIPHLDTFWFAWFSYNPGTELIDG